MRSTFTGLNTMVRGILANQLSLDTVGHNITNASTDGYSRQNVNLAATRGEARGSLYGDILVGTGVDAMSITRARSIYADRQFWSETATQEYYDVMQQNYEKLETIFDDSDQDGIQNAMHRFWETWQTLSANSSDDYARRNVISQAELMVNMIRTAADEMQVQMEHELDEIGMRVNDINDITSKIVLLNTHILEQEVTGATANDLRDQRDLLVDELSKYINVDVRENADGQYNITSSNLSLVSGASRLTLSLSNGFSSGGKGGLDGVRYGVTEYSVIVSETNIVFQPTNGSMKGNFDAIDECKYFIDQLATVSALMLTSFNEQHKAGYDLEGNAGQNFFGRASQTYTYGEFKFNAADEDYLYCYVEANGSKLTGIDIISELQLNSNITAYGGGKYLAANATTQTTGQGNNAVLLSNFFTMNRAYTEQTGDTISYYYYSDAGGNSLITFLDDIITTEDSTREIVYAGDDGMVYRSTDTATGAVTYVDGYGKTLSIGTNNGNVVFTGDGKTYTTSTDGFLVYENQYDGEIYKRINADGTIEYLEAGAAITMSRDTASNTVTYTGASNTYVANRSEQAIRAIGDVSIYGYYDTTMSTLGIRSETMDLKVEMQEDVMTQVNNWRASEMGVDWNEELTNMIRFQKGFGACARCLTAMDEMLDRLVNNTGMVGR